MSKENEIVALDSKHNEALITYDLSQSFSDICVQISNKKSNEIKHESPKKGVTKKK